MRLFTKNPLFVDGQYFCPNSRYINFGFCRINQVSWFNNNKNVRNFLTGLGIPENDKVYGSLCVGYRDGGMPVAQKRKENTVSIIK